MKIEILNIYNLNSLCGNFRIDFTISPFNGSGIFAITGPTGAGKSTIFDAICLALYGRTPRLKNPEEIMSRHTGECYSELTFSINGIRYRSRWEQRRSRGKVGGKIQAPNMSLVKINNNKNETLLEEKKSNVQNRIPLITGLDYEQFTRSIMLAQGNFASFLKANSNERAELLEKMTGSEIYTHLSIEAFNRSKEKEEALQRLKEKSGDTEILSRDNRDEIESKLKSLNEKREIKLKHRRSLEEARTWREQDIVLTHRMDNFQFELEEAKNKQEESEQDQEEFRRLKTINENMSLYESWDYLQNESHRIQNETSQLKETKEILENSLVEQKKELESKKEKKIIVYGRAEKILKTVRSIEIKQELIKNLEKNKRNLIEELKGIEKSLSENNVKLTEWSKEILELQNNRKAVEKKIDNYKRFEMFSETLSLLKELDNRFRILTGKKVSDFKDFPEYLRLKKIEFTNLNKKISIIKDEKPGDINELERVKEILRTMGPLSKSYLEKKNDIRNLTEGKDIYVSELTAKTLESDKIKKHQDKFFSHKAEREFKLLVNEVKSHIHDGDICPVCSGVFHSKNNDFIEISSDETETLENKEEVLNTLIAQISVLKERIHDSESRIVILRSDLEKIMDEWDKASENLFPELRPDDRERAIEIYSQNEQKIFEFNNWQRELEHLKKEREDSSNLIERQEEANQIYDKMSSIIDPADISIKNSNYLEDIIQGLENYKTALKRQENLDSRILEKNHQIKIRTTPILDLTKNKAKIENSLKSLEIEIDDQLESLNELSEGNSTEFLEKKSKELQIQADVMLEQASSQLSEVENKLSEINGTVQYNLESYPRIIKDLEIKEKKFTGLLKAEALIIDDFQQQNLPQKLKELKNKIDQANEEKIRAEQSYHEAMEILNDHREKIPDALILKESENGIEAIDEQIDLISREIGTFEERIKRDNEMRAKLDILTEKIEKAQQENRKWSKLKSLIGSADGKLYRRFVQGLTLDKLIDLANIHLLKINDRYRLERSEGQELKIVIVDSWQADTIRAANTLSGGESFLVSLSLSLGLSELVGNKVVLDSLFLDEGFGTLDSDSLETVLSSLEALQAGGKLIGIISHVTAIRERIAVQIRVIKQSGGRSTIQIV